MTRSFAFPTIPLLAALALVGLPSRAAGDAVPPALPAAGVAAPAATPEPSRAANDPEAFPVTLASFVTTLIGSTPARTANIRLAAAALDGTIIGAGEEMSFNAIVGDRTVERGYQDAPVILREARQLQTGGGICQVATTLFDAGLLSGLTPIERHRHSTPVDYVAIGEDATIAWGAKDLRLRNDWSQPVRLRIEVVGRTLSARFEAAEPSGERYELEREESEIPASSAEGTPGREIELYRVRHLANGEVEREFILRDTYPPSRSLAERNAP